MFVSNEVTRFRTMKGVYEPSAIQQLPDGRFIVVEDEKQRPISLITIGIDGSVSSETLGPQEPLDDKNTLKEFWKLDDLEGVAVDNAGYIYAITSHSRDNNGDEKKSREKLVRFQIEGNRVVRPLVVRGLKQWLVAVHPVLAASAEVEDVKNEAGLNIEALEMSADQNRLLLGFRSPLCLGRAIMASIDNPAALFERGEAPRISTTLETLDLGGHGIRGMAYIPSLGGYLVISGPVARQRIQFGLWFWTASMGEEARPVTIAGLPGFEHAEGVTPAVIEGQERIIIVSDDGSREAGRFARFLMLDPQQLQIGR